MTVDHRTTHSDVGRRQRESMKAVNIALGANMLLAAMKTTIGVLAHSPALLADGVNSTSDVVYGLVVAVFMRLSHKPADREHPFGHGQLESIAALVVGAFVITTAVGIFWDAVNTVFDQLTSGDEAVTAGVVALWAALLTVGLKVALFVYTRRVGRRHKSAAVTALAYDHRNDIFSAGAAALGIAFARAGQAWVDPLAAALVAVVILRESASDLMDAVPGDDLDRQVNGLLREIPGVIEVQQVRSHRFGQYLAMELTIAVDGRLTVDEGDRICTQAESALRDAVDFLASVHIHYHPPREGGPPGPR